MGDPVPTPQHASVASGPAVSPPPAPAPGAHDPFGGRPAELFKTKFQDAILGTGFVPPAVLQEIMSYWDQHQVGGPQSPLNQATVGQYGQGLSADAKAILAKAFGGVETPAQQMAKLAPGWWASLQPGYQQTPQWTSAGVPTNAAAQAYDKANGVRPWGDAGLAASAASDAAAADPSGATQLASTQFANPATNGVAPGTSPADWQQIGNGWFNPTTGAWYGDPAANPNRQQ
jgi:hypothetical protein